MPSQSTLRNEEVSPATLNQRHIPACGLWLAVCFPTSRQKSGVMQRFQFPHTYTEKVFRRLHITPGGHRSQLQEGSTLLKIYIFTYQFFISFIKRLFQIFSDNMRQFALISGNLAKNLTQSRIPFWQTAVKDIKHLNWFVYSRKILNLIWTFSTEA